MAVKGALHAAVAAHFQASWNRTRREMDSGKAWVVTVILALVALLVLVPSLLGATMAGYLSAEHLAHPLVASGLGAVLTLIPLAIGAVEGIFAGGRQVAWEAHRAFPLSRSTQFFAELTAGVGSMNFLLFGSLALVFFVGVALQRPALAPLAALAWVWGGCTQVLAAQLAGSLALAATKHLRFLLVFGLVAFSLVPVAMVPRSETRSRQGRASQEAVTRERLKQLDVQLERVAQWLPATQGVKASAALQEGRLGAALAHLSVPMGFLGLMLGVVGWLFLREEDAPGGTHRVARNPTADRVWTFRAPVEGLARLHLRSLFGSYLGRFALLGPVVAIVLLKGMAQSKLPGTLVIPAVLSYALLTGNTLMFNQFGLDRQGIKTLFLLPLSGQEILAGKALGVGAFLSLNLFASILLCFFFMPFSLLAGLQALALAAGLLAVHLTVGHWASIWLPRAVPWDHMRGNNLPMPVAFLTIGVTLGSAVGLGGPFLLLSWLAPSWVAPVMVVLAGLCWGLYRWVALPLLGAYLDQNRERVLHALEG